MRKNNSFAKDLIVIAFLSIVTFIVAARFDIFEQIYSFTQRYEEYEIDEIVTVMIILSVAFGIFAFRRWWDFKYVAKKQVNISQKLEKALIEKEVLLKEFHNRLNNNLQVISRLLSLQSLYVKDPDVSSLFIDNEYRIRSIALIHEKLYQSQSADKIKFKGYVTSLCGDLMKQYSNSANSVHLEVTIPPIEISMDSAASCGLILNELICNSLKHAFPGGKGTISIIMTQEAINEYNLQVKDDGIGLPKNFRIEDKGSLGLFFVSGIVKGQLDGKIELNNSEGTSWSIQFQDKALIK